MTNVVAPIAPTLPLPPYHPGATDVSTIPVSTGGGEGGGGEGPGSGDSPSSPITLPTLPNPADAISKAIADALAAAAGKIGTGVGTAVGNAEAGVSNALSNVEQQVVRLLLFGGLAVLLFIGIWALIMPTADQVEEAAGHVGRAAKIAEVAE